MTSAERKLEWCLRKAEKEGRKHRGLKEVIPDVHKADDHIAKAEHNIEVMELLIRLGYSDWAVSASFYAQYHCLLAILRKFGYESRNQECTFAVVEILIERGTIPLELSELHRIFATDKRDTLENADIVDQRERYQYGTETSVEEATLQELTFQTKNFLETTKTILQL